MADAATLNGLRATRVRLLIPWRGAWVADVELDPDSVSQAPTGGPATLVVGGATLTGTVDPRGTGSFVAGAAARVVAGAGGWDEPVTASHFHADNGVRSTNVYAATASLVSETVNDLAPATLGIDFVRSAGPASRVLDAVDWWVDLTGVTQVGARPTPTADPSLQIIAWDALEQRAELQCEALVLPGTVLSDPRFNGVTPTVRDVEQSFDGHAFRATAWCSSAPVSRLASALRRAVREMGGRTYLTVYEYRIVQQNSDGRLQLQAVHPTDGLPDTLPVSIWTGTQGVSASVLPGAQVLVEFVAGDPTRPVARGFALGATPVSLTLDATTAVHVGPDAASVDVAGGASALVPAPWAAALAQALLAFANGLNPTTLAGQAATLVTALGLLPPAATTKTKAT